MTSSNIIPDSHNYLRSCIMKQTCLSCYFFGINVIFLDLFKLLIPWNECYIYIFLASHASKFPAYERIVLRDCEWPLVLLVILLRLCLLSFTTEAVVQSCNVLVMPSKSHVYDRYTVAPRYNAVVGVHEMEPRCKRGAL